MQRPVKSTRNSESGNVLFLILIAVALFAALSYAVTQSSRSGGGDASSEKSLVAGSEVTQYPAGVRTAIMRMIVTSGITADQLMFDTPSSFGTAITAANQRYSVFYPTGGGATYQQAPFDVMANGAPGTWHFNALYQIANIGTTSTGSDPSGNEIIAFLDGITSGVCSKIDSQLGITTVPVVGTALTTHTTDQVASSNGSTTSTFPATSGTVITSVPVITGQPFGCFRNGAAGNYVYYHVLIER